MLQEFSPRQSSGLGATTSTRPLALPSPDRDSLENGYSDWDAQQVARKGSVSENASSEARMALRKAMPSAVASTIQVQLKYSNKSLSKINSFAVKGVLSAH